MITLKAGVCLGCLAWMISVPSYAARYFIEVLPDPFTEASGINARGDIVGDNFVFEHRTHAVSTLSCSGTGCSVLGASAINFDFASSVNDLDQVVGSFSAADGVTTALLDRNGVVKSLGSLDNQPTSNSQANSINDHGEIVGWSDLHPSAGQPSVPRAFVYRRGQMANLMSELDANETAAKTAVLTNAVAINCDGWIVANGFDSVTGANHAYLLKPKDPERRLECVILKLL